MNSERHATAARPVFVLFTFRTRSSLGDERVWFHECKFQEVLVDAVQFAL